MVGYLFLSFSKAKPTQEGWVLLCERVTKRSRIEVRVSKSSATVPFDKLEFVTPLNWNF